MTRMYRTFSITVLLVNLAVIQSFTFLPSRRTSMQAQQPPQQSKTKLSETLRFSGEYTCLSEAFPIDQKADLIEFLKKKENQMILYNSGGKRQADYIEDMETTMPQLVQYWDEMREKYYGMDKKCDYVIACATTSQFPGLKSQINVANACSLVYDKIGMPMLESYLIGEMQTVTGLKPIVWLFNALTGNDKKPKGVYLKPSGHVVSCAQIVEVPSNDDNGDNNEGGEMRVALQYKVEVEIIVEFPATLLKILPTSKEKMEEQGSNSVLKAVGRDVKESVEAFSKVFSVTNKAKNLTLQ